MPPRLRSFGKAQTEEDEKLEEEAHVGTEALRSRTEGYADVRWRNVSLGDKVIRPSNSAYFNQRGVEGIWEGRAGGV